MNLLHRFRYLIAIALILVFTGQGFIPMAAPKNREAQAAQKHIDQSDAADTYVPPKGSDHAVYLSGLDLSKMTGTYYTTTKEEYIETSRFVLYLDEGVEIPVNIIELINYIMDTIETETGYKFYVQHKNGNEYFGMNYELEKYFDNAAALENVNSDHERVEIVVKEHDQIVEAYSNGGNGILIKPEHIKLLDGNANVIIHELLHIAWLRNGCNMGRVLDEGFSTYYTSRIIEKDQVLHCTFDSYDQFSNYENIITEDTMEDLFLNYTAGQSAYQLGFRMTAFIIENYGAKAYRWVHDKVSKLYDDSKGADVPMDIIAAALKSELSGDFFKAFAKWQNTNRERFKDKDMTSAGDWFIEYGFLRKYYGKASEVMIPDTVINIQPEAFMACKSLRAVIIPETVTQICAGAFSDCINLKEIIIPDSVTEIIFNTFDGCSNLKKVILPKGLKNIAIGLFTDCVSLTEVKLPEGLTIIESNAFTNCKALPAINLPDTLETIENGVFMNCSSLKSIKIPDSVKDISTGVFNDCSSLKKVVLPKGLKEVKGGTFWGCKSLKNINLPYGLTSIGECAFNSTALKSVNIPNTVKTIGAFAYANCSNLKRIIIPESVTSIGEEVFYGCKNLIIYGVKGSEIEEYAKSNHLKFKEIKK